jgi:hypothetical protein
MIYFGRTITKLSEELGGEEIYAKKKISVYI